MKRWLILLAFVLALGLLAGCAAAPEPAPDTTEQTVFEFTRENFPRMDGSTSMVPLGQAVASVLLGESREAVSDLVQFNRIASDALIFVVNAGNPVNNLTTEQVRQIYAGEISNWAQVGGNDAPIMAFQRNEDAGSQALMRKLVMGDVPMAEAPVDYTIGSMFGLMEVVKSYDNSANAIGYSVYYYAYDMEMAQGLKILSIDGVAPSAETIRSGAYPHLNAYYCVIPADAALDSPNRVLYEWLMTPEGQQLLALEGYVSVLEVEG